MSQSATGSASSEVSKVGGYCSFIYPYERYGNEVPDENMQFIVEMYVYQEWSTELRGRIMWLEGAVEEDPDQGI